MRLKLLHCGRKLIGAPADILPLIAHRDLSVHPDRLPGRDGLLAVNKHATFGHHNKRLFLFGDKTALHQYVIKPSFFHWLKIYDRWRDSYGIAIAITEKIINRIPMARKEFRSPKKVPSTPTAMGPKKYPALSAKVLMPEICSLA